MLRIITGCNLKPIEGAINFPVMHPYQEFDYARKLIKKSISKDIILVTYSAGLIESVDAWAEWYKIDVKYILIDTNEMRKEIPSNKLYKLYSNLAEGYRRIDKLRIRTRYRAK